MADSLCEVCLQRPGERYAFHYGRVKARSAARQVGTTQQVTVTYEIGGTERVTICNRCVLRRSLLQAAAILIPFIAGSVVGLLFSKGFSKNLPAIAFWAPVAFLIVLFWSKAVLGETMAIKRRKRALTEAGWTTFWKPKQYAALQKAKGNF